MVSAPSSHSSSSTHPRADLPFREQVVAKFTEMLGQAHVARVREGELYRWTLPRGTDHIAIFVTIDSPELPMIAHIMVSDGDDPVEPISTLTVRTMAEAEAVLQRIIEQWNKTRPVEAPDAPSA